MPNRKLLSQKAIEKLRVRDREEQRQKRLLNPELKSLQNKKYRTNNIEKVHAHSLLNGRIRSGKIKRGKCRDCERTNTQGHHPDYSKPLQVIWLCPIHHKLEHLRSSLLELTKELKK